MVSRRGAVRSFTPNTGAGNAAELGFHARSVVITTGNNRVTIHPWGQTFGPNLNKLVWMLPQASSVATFDVLPAQTIVSPSVPQQQTIIDYHEDALAPNPGTPNTIQDLPAAPLNLKAVVVDSGVTLSWQAVTSDPPVLGYQVRLNFTEPPFETQATSLSINSLTNGQIYQFTVNAINALGPGPSSGIIYPAPVAAVPWQPITEAAQIAHTHLAGTVPDSVPTGTNPVWTVGPGGDYTVALNTGIYIPGGGASSFAAIDPQAGGNRTINVTFFSTNVQPVYIYPIHDGVGANWLAVILVSTPPTPCIAVQARIGGVTGNIGLLGTAYANDTWQCNLNIKIVGNTLSIVFNAVNVAGNATMAANTGSAPIVFNNILLNYRDFGFQLFDANATVHQAIYSYGFTAP